MAGAVLPDNLSAERTCYRVWWPDGEDWYSLLIGAMSRLYRADYWATDDEDELRELSETVLNAIAASLDDRGCEMRILGEIVAYAGAVPPAGWLLCDGSIFQRADYPELYDLLGDAYGPTSETQSVLPNLRARVPVGRASGDADFGSLGNVGGEKTHTLTVGEMPVHNHGYMGGNGSIRNDVTWGTNVGNGSGIVRHSGAGTTYDPFIQPTGGGGAHNNLQPFQTVNYIIYVGFPG